jgi:uncharacterized protein (DUF1800 family)
MSRERVPDDPLAPWHPTDADPFDLGAAGHLFRRLHGGVDLETRRRAVRRGLRRTLRALFDRRSEGRSSLDGWADVPVALGDAAALRAYRVWRLLDATDPLAERMAMFWHDHFATSIAKVADVGQMARQLALFDRLGLGSFEQLTLAVARDPAMIRWLDNDSNTAEHPNENFARELLELFTLGRGGGYDEHDVREAARAFTGFDVRDGEFEFVERHHDGGDKTVLGARGSLRGEDVVRLAVAHPDTHAHVARRLLAFLVHPEPSEPEIEAVARCFAAHDGEIAPVVETIARSRTFFSARARRSRIKDPLDWTVGSARLLGVRVPPRQAAEAAADLGLSIAAPPSVEGFPRERQWLTSTTWLRRANYAAEVLCPAAAEALADLGSTPDRLVTTLVDALLDGLLDSDSTGRLVDLARRTPAADRVAATTHAVLLLPEAQLL